VAGLHPLHSLTHWSCESGSLIFIIPLGSARRARLMRPLSQTPRRKMQINFYLSRCCCCCVGFAKLRLHPTSQLWPADAMFMFSKGEGICFIIKFSLDEMEFAAKMRPANSTLGGRFAACFVMNYE
jgi:cyanate permease